MQLAGGTATPANVPLTASFPSVLAHCSHTDRTANHLCVPVHRPPETPFLPPKPPVIPSISLDHRRTISPPPHPNFPFFPPKVERESNERAVSPLASS
ncbi:hypothetical protein ANO14919_114980 [Xylariales sp. No.14919]|nr:hypothetical protein ANO14919_114980 [Xylariales sp. No.14919]